MSHIHRPKTASGFLIPARNSRHRIACLALYRALLRLAPQISLPDDLTTGWGPSVKNPITNEIQRAFRRNVNDTSPRIVFPALQAGYRMLSVLHDAAAASSSSSSSSTSRTSSEHHGSIVTFLRARLSERQRSLANRPDPTKRRPTSTPRPAQRPLLVNVTAAPTLANPFPKPEFAVPHRPVPQSALGGSGRRQIPHLDMAGDYPFLRLKKPQPLVLNRVLRQKMMRRVKRVRELQQLTSEASPDARLEDEWEADIARLVREETKKGKIGNGDIEGEFHISKPRVAYGQSHEYTVDQHGVLALTTALTREREQQVARAEAMRQLIKQETALAAREKAQRKADRRARWEAKMLELHGERWKKLFPNLKETGQTEPKKSIVLDEDNIEGGIDELVKLMVSKRR